MKEKLIKYKNYIISYLLLVWMSLNSIPGIALANTDTTDAGTYTSQIYTNYLWPFVYLIIAGTLYMGIVGFIRALLTLSWNSANPNARLTAYKTLFREFVFLAIDGSFGLLFSLVVSCLTYA